MRGSAASVGRSGAGRNGWGINRPYPSKRKVPSDMRITTRCVVAWALLLGISWAAKKAAAETASECLYNDEHFHIQDFKAEGPRLSEVLRMMDRHVCRTTLMSL